MYCFQREPNQPIPGCPDFGPGYDARNDYCVEIEEAEEEVDGEEPDTETFPDPEQPPAMETDAPDMGTDAPTMGTDAPDMGTEVPEEATEMPMEDTPTEMPMEDTPTEMPMDDSASDMPTEDMMETASPTETETAGESAPEVAIVVAKSEEELGELTFAGQNGEGDAFPLGVCEGDCDK